MNYFTENVPLFFASDVTRNKCYSGIALCWTGWKLLQHNNIILKNDLLNETQIYFEPMQMPVVHREKQRRDVRVMVSN